MSLILKIYKSPYSGGVSCHIIATPDITSRANLFITPYLQLSITSMRPPARMTRTNNNPGVVDLPKSRRSSADVAAERSKSKKTAAADAKKKREQAAQVARVEEEIRIAHTGGKGQYTQWVHCELIVGSETIRPAHTQRVNSGHFQKVPSTHWGQRCMYPEDT